MTLFLQNQPLSAPWLPQRGWGRDQGAICAYMAAVELSPPFLVCHHGQITLYRNTKMPPGENFLEYKYS